MLLQFVLIASTAAMPGFPQSTTAETVSARIAGEGAKSTLTRLYANEGSWAALLRGIASGTSSWLAVARDLRPVSDAGASEQLDLVVGEALEHRPTNVLRLAIPPFVLEAVCGGPDTDDARYDGVKRAMRAVELRERKLREIHDHDLEMLRDRCILELEKSKAGIARFYGVAR